jgi:hypothetical protein
MSKASIIDWIGWGNGMERNLLGEYLAESTSSWRRGRVPPDDRWHRAGCPWH